MVDDQLFREVEDELRKERFKAFWDRFGVMVTACVAGLMLAGLAFWYWQSAQQTQRENAGDAFIKALKLSSQDKGDEALPVFERLSKEGPKGYAALSSLHVASIYADKGKRDEAAALYKKVGDDPSADKILADYAKLNLALLQLDGASYEATLKGLSGFLAPKANWRPLALEAVALAAFKEGKLDIAKQRFSEIVADATAPSALKRRAQILLDVIATKAARG